jgi:hypothetical protein
MFEMEFLLDAVSQDKCQNCDNYQILGVTFFVGDEAGPWNYRKFTNKIGAGAHGTDMAEVMYVVHAVTCA